jgi:hypothetical protein
MMLPDNTVVPSHQNVVDTARLGPMTGQFQNWGLRLGLVREIIKPADKRSVSKKFNEYQVEVVWRDRMGRTCLSTYPNCYIASPFGGKGDKSMFTPRFSPQTTQAGIGEGSKVIIGHLNGDKHQAVILAGIRDHDDAPDQDLGHNLHWEFNGIRSVINDDGEFKISFLGATKYDGSLRDGVNANASGTFVQMLKDGNLLVQHDNQKLELQHDNQAWLMEAEQGITHKVTVGDYLLDVNGLGEFFADREIVMGSRGAITLTSNTGVHIGADAAFAVDHLVKGDTWQRAEMQLLTKLMGYLAVAGGSLTTAAASMLVPIAGPIAAAPQMLLAAQALIQMTAAIGTYMSQMPTFLSMKNTTD